jgi:hypothetical protein
MEKTTAKGFAAKAANRYLFLAPGVLISLCISAAIAGRKNNYVIIISK